MGRDKWNGRSDPASNHMRAWESEAFEACRTDPNFLHDTICYVCEGNLPICHCNDRCASCGKAFGQYACQCRGKWISAFDKKTGARIFPEPDENQKRLAHLERYRWKTSSRHDPQPPSLMDGIRGRHLRKKMQKEEKYRYLLSLRKSPDEQL